VHSQHDARQLARPKRSKDPATALHTVTERFRKAVGESPVERNRQADITICWEIWHSNPDERQEALT